MQRRRTIGLLALALVSFCASGQPPDEKFSWNLGVALASVSFPAYRGSNVRETLVLPAPAFSFSSPRLQLDRKGAHLSLLDFGWLHFRLSAGGSLPADSDDVPLRSGMPDLNSSFELGPAAVIDLPCTAPWYCRQETLLRGVVATDLQSWDAIGWTLQPRLTWGYQQHKPRNMPQHGLRMTLGPLLASRRYHDYYYSVDAQYATPQRPAYAARGGYSGWRSSVSYNYQRNRLGITLYMAFDDTSGSRFQDSPLLERSDYWVGGLFMRWYLFSSQPW